MISLRGLRLALLDRRDRRAWQALPVLKARQAWPVREATREPLGRQDRKGRRALLAYKGQRVQLVQLVLPVPKATLAASGRKAQTAWLVLLALQVRKGRKAQQA